MISLIVPLTFIVLLVSGSISLSVYAVPPDANWDEGSCGAETRNYWGERQQTCCWTERVPGKLPPLNKENYCQTCILTSAGKVCDPKVKQLISIPGDSRSPLEGGVLEQPPTPPRFPGGGANVPQDGGVLEQPSTDESSTLPPLIGRGQESSLTANEVEREDFTIQQQQQPVVDETTPESGSVQGTENVGESQLSDQSLDQLSSEEQISQNSTE